MTRTLITGGAGFIGSWLAEALIAVGDDVIVLDDLSTGTRQNIAMLAAHPRFTLVIGDARHEATVAPLVAQADRIVHLAATVGVQLALNSPTQAIENTIMSAMSVLRAAAIHRRMVLLASTSEVYGRGDRVPFHEDDTLLFGAPTVGRWSYACAKLLDEFLAAAYAREYDVPVVIVRLFNTIGPRQRGEYGMVLPRFVAAARAGAPLYVYGDGRQTRSFCDVRDTVAALIGLLDTPDARGMVINVGNPEEISIHALAERVIDIAKSNSMIQFISYDVAYGVDPVMFEDIQRRSPDISKINRIIGWLPKFQLDDSLKYIFSSIS
ncbi:MAG: GDP-mannose 4,6-dehydratase [Chloroflexi bacterium]|nr:GDP-mannose 4,6-dehydratase [Chloroflexota bacterium]